MLLSIKVVGYVPPFAFERNEDNTGIDQSFKGKRMNDILALVYKQNSGEVSKNDNNNQMVTLKN